MLVSGFNGLPTGVLDTDARLKDRDQRLKEVAGIRAGQDDESSTGPSYILTTVIRTLFHGAMYKVETGNDAARVTEAD